MKKKRTPKQKHVPQRTCVVCRQKKDKRLLTRIVNNPDEGLIIDPSGKKNGRGAYLCDQTECWDNAKNSQLLDKALRTDFSAAAKTALFSQLKESAGEQKMP